MGLEPKQYQINGDTVEKGDTLVTIRSIDHGDIRGTLMNPNKYPTLERGTIVKFLQMYRNLVGNWARVETQEGKVYDLPPDSLRLQNKDEKEEKYFIWIPKAQTDQYGTVYLPEYADGSETAVKGNILSDAVKEGYEGGIDERLEELGWEIVKVKLVEVENEKQT